VRLRYLEASPSRAVRPRGTLLLIHAFPVNARMFEGQLGLSEHGWHVVAPQLRQFDGGDAEPPASSLDDYAGDVIDLLDGLRVEEAVIGGVSMGGYIAFAMFRRAPRYFQGLILADTKAEADTPEAVQGRQRMLQLVGEKGPSAVADDMIPKMLGATTRAKQPELAERVRSLIVSSSSQAIAAAVKALMTRPDSAELLSSIHCPTLLVVGEEDTVTPKPAAEVMHRGIKGSELVTIPDAGHLANMEQTAAFNAALARFLERRI
jgi:pimeloyl-ACP methyl ester carboxylesterase